MLIEIKKIEREWIMKDENIKDKEKMIIHNIIISISQLGYNTNCRFDAIEGRVMHIP